MLGAIELYNYVVIGTGLGSLFFGTLIDDTDVVEIEANGLTGYTILSNLLCLYTCVSNNTNLGFLAKFS